MTTQDEIRARIEQRMEALGLTRRSVSLSSGLSSHFLQRFMTQANTSMTVDNLLKLSRTLQVAPEWLLTGRSATEPPLGAVELFDLYTRLSPANRETLMNFARWTLDNQE
ncbi:hypothetical protein [Hyphomonas sp. UBA4494]|jgi:transcriptional regulator with XRE-family HTH domain|uniref:hypothetical protein n=1 Tax=Hyphomonas sp. UBA4494 TaxID=1946631 RepID=UPI0025BB748A|nr:hypothetical protein [Hyphomonas sp. UBA4494]